MSLLNMFVIINRLSKQKLIDLVFIGGNVDEFDKDPVWADIFPGNEPAMRYEKSNLIDV